MTRQRQARKTPAVAPQPSDSGPPRLNLRWMAGCRTPEERADRAAIVIGARHVLDMECGIIEEMIAECNRGLREYDNPSWPFKMADSLGYIRALQDIRKIINMEHVLRGSDQIDE